MALNKKFFVHMPEQLALELFHKLQSLKDLQEKFDFIYENTLFFGLFEIEEKVIGETTYRFGIEQTRSNLEDAAFYLIQKRKVPLYNQRKTRLLNRLSQCESIEEKKILVSEDLKYIKETIEKFEEQSNPNPLDKAMAVGYRCELRKLAYYDFISYDMSKNVNDHFTYLAAEGASAAMLEVKDLYPLLKSYSNYAHETSNNSVTTRTSINRPSTYTRKTEFKAKKLEEIWPQTKIAEYFKLVEFLKKPCPLIEDLSFIIIEDNQTKWNRSIPNAIQYLAALAALLQENKIVFEGKSGREIVSVLNNTFNDSINKGPFNNLAANPPDRSYKIPFLKLCKNIFKQQQ